MTPSEAKKLTKSYLDDNQMTYDKMKAKTVHFSSLRESRVVVSVYGVEASIKNSYLKTYAIICGFQVTFPEFAEVA